MNFIKIILLFLFFCFGAANADETEILKYDAKYTIGSVLYDNGDYAKAIPYLEEASMKEAGSHNISRSLFLLGLIYYEGGDGVEKNFKKAKSVFEELIKNDPEDASANHIIGRIYFFGHGVNSDPAMGVKFFKIAAEAGHPLAQHDLGKAYLVGVGIQQDYFKAKYWLEKAMEQKEEYKTNYTDPAFELGLMHQEGLGFRQDYKKAKELFGLACDGGLQKSCDEYRELNEKGY